MIAPENIGRKYPLASLGDSAVAGVDKVPFTQGPMTWR